MGFLRLALFEFLNGETYSGISLKPPADRDCLISSSSYNWLSRQFHWFIAVLDLCIAFALRIDDGGPLAAFERANSIFMPGINGLGFTYFSARCFASLLADFVTKATRSFFGSSSSGIFHFGAKVGALFTLCSCYLLLPLVGWLRSSSAGFEIVIFEVLPVPDLIG